jgi:hypothetical protein
MPTKYIRDNISDANEILFSSLMDVVARGKSYLGKRNPFSYDENILAFDANVIFTIRNPDFKSFITQAGETLSEADLDTGTFQVGSDYYVYLVDDGGNGKFIISANSTYPGGQSANNSRKIGGFHYGHIRKVSGDGGWCPVDSTGVRFGAGGTIWQNNVTTGIVPNSVWDLVNRPTCAPEGMALVGNLWVDIYPASEAETVSFEDAENGLFTATGRLQSKYGLVPVTGTEGLHWYNFQELASRSGKRLLTYGEWVKGAYGNPGGQDTADDYGWTKTTNTARARCGCQVNSSGVYDPQSLVKRFAVSAHNLCDCVGNVWEWVDELTIRQESTSWAWQNVLGADKGQAYLPNNIGLSAFVCGGNRPDGVYCGGRTVNLLNCPWYVNTGVGARLACDKPAP